MPFFENRSERLLVIQIPTLAKGRPLSWPSREGSHPSKTFALPPSQKFYDLTQIALYETPHICVRV